MKSRTYKNEKLYKDYKNNYEKIKTRAKQNYYSSLLNDSVGNTKKTWDIMKEIIGKSESDKNTLPKQLHYKNDNLSEKSKIAESFNDFFDQKFLTLRRIFTRSYVNVRL